MDNLDERISEINELSLSEEFILSLKRSIYTQSYYEFFKAFFHILTGGEPYNDNWHIKYICDRLQSELVRIQERRIREKDIIINIPFRASKSLMVTVAFPVWCWLIRPSTKFICTSYSASLALEHADLARTLIRCELFQKLFGDKIKFIEDENTKGFYKIEGGGFRKSVGMGGQITGSGGDVIIVDDPQNPKMSASEVERESVKTFYDYTLYSRLNNPELGVRIIIMQRLHMEDLSGYLLEKSPDAHEHICMPVEVDRTKMDKANLHPVDLLKYYDEKGLFWPTRFTRKIIDDFTRVLGSREAAGQLLQLPAPKEGNLVREAWFEIVDPATISRDLRANPINFYVDTAETEDQENDFSAICMAFKKDNILYIGNIVKTQKAFFELCKFLPEWVNANMYSSYSMIKVEPKSSGKSIVSQLKSTTMLNIVELPAPTDSKVVRMNSITPLCEAGRVKFLRGNWIDAFKPNLLAFPNAKHDDDVDVFIHAVEDMLGRSDFDFTFL